MTTEDPIEIVYEQQKDPIEQAAQEQLKIRYRVPKIKSSTFIDLFREKFLEKVGFTYQIQNWQVTHNYVKLKIIDYFLENELTVEDMRDFIEFIFSKPREQWILFYAAGMINEWLVQSKKKPQRSSAIDDARPVVVGKIEESRREEIQYLHFFGEGFRDNELTKEQFWVGLYWRRKHLKLEQRRDLSEWQNNNFGSEVIEKLGGWETEYETSHFDAHKQFYIELARMTSTSVMNCLERLYRLSLRYKYTPEELNSIPE